MWRVGIALVVLAAGCHLALGLEPAGEIDSSTTSETMPDVDCTEHAQCADENPCTNDACLNGVCENQPLDEPAGAELQTDGDCKQVVCQQGTLTEIDDDDDVRVDDITCTSDTCSGGVPANDPLAGGTPCETGVCNGEGVCAECFDDDQCTAPETCGGGGNVFACGCTPITCLDVGLTCGNAPNGCVGALNCDTGTQNGNETDVDCGGATSTCPRRCPADAMCNVNSDCNSNNCDTGGTGLCIGN